MTALLTAIGSFLLPKGGVAGVVAVAAPRSAPRSPATREPLSRRGGGPFAWFPPSLAADASELETGGRRFLFLDGPAPVHLWLKCRDRETLRSKSRSPGQMLSRRPKGNYRKAAEIRRRNPRRGPQSPNRRRYSAIRRFHPSVASTGRFTTTRGSRPCWTSRAAFTSAAPLPAKH